MKNPSLFIISCVLLVTGACRSIEDHAITGIYVAHYRQEYSRGDDTLIVAAFNLQAHTYQIERRTGYHQIREGKELPRKYEVESWTAVFNEENQLLQEADLGRKIYLRPDKKELVLGRTVYHYLEQP